MTQPEYTMTHVYAVLSDLCRRAGLQVQYADIPASVYARSKGRVIQMPLDDRFTSGDHAAVVLGHELAHHFVNPQFPEIESGAPLSMTRRMLLESECDRVGTYFFSLATAIANEEEAAPVNGGLVN